MKLIATNCAWLMVVASVSAIMQATAAAPHEATPRKVVFEKVEFNSDADWVVIEEGITMVGEDTAVNIQSNVKKSIPDLSLINIELSKEKTADEYNMILKTGDVAVCELLKNATATQPLIKNMILKVLEFTNAPYQCPLPVGQYYLKDFVMDPAIIPSFIPEGRYKVNIGVFQPMPSHKLLYGTEIIFSLTKKM